MQLIEDDRAHVAEHPRRVGMRDQKRDLLGRGEQNVRRNQALALPPPGWRIPGARFDAQTQPHFLDRGQQIALHIDCQRLQR